MSEKGERSYRLQLLSDEQLCEFVRRGVLAIPLDDLHGDLHAEYAEKAFAMSLAPQDKPKYGNPAQAIGGGLENAMNDIFRSARFHGALHSLLGPDFMIGNNWEDDGSTSYSYRMHVSREDTNQQWHLDGTDHGNTQSTVRDIKPRQLVRQQLGSDSLSLSLSLSFSLYVLPLYLPVYLLTSLVSQMAFYYPNGATLNM